MQRKYGLLETVDNLIANPSNRETFDCINKLISTYARCLRYAGVEFKSKPNKHSIYVLGLDNHAHVLLNTSQQQLRADGMNQYIKDRQVKAGFV